MFGKFNRFNVVLSLLLVVSVVFFYGSFFGFSDDPDYLASQENLNLSTEGNTLFNIPYERPVYTLQTDAADTITLNANPGPSNNGGATGYAIFANLVAGSNNIIVTQMSSGNTATAGASFTVEVFTRTGNALGGPVGSGPGSSSAGWTSLGTVPATQGATSQGISELFNIPPIMVPAGDTVGVAFLFTGAGPRYFGTGTPPYSTYSDTNITLITGDSRTAPFTTTGSFFSSRALTGVIRYVVDAPPPPGNSLCFSRGGIWVSIPDNMTGTARDTIKVPNNMGALDDITVVMDTVIHTWVGDLIFDLSHGGQVDTLFAWMGTGSFGNSGDNLFGIALTDSSNNPIVNTNGSNTVPPPAGQYLAGGRTGVDSLKKHFVRSGGAASEMNGNWVLTMHDRASGDTGSLRAWHICFYSGNIAQIISNNNQTPDRYVLGQNYPNPFNPSTKINFSIPKAGLVSLKVYDMLGREVKTLVADQLSAGEFAVDFDGSNLSSGTYFYRLQVGDFVEVKKMVLLK